MHLEARVTCDHFECPVCFGSGYRPYPAADAVAKDGDGAVRYKCLGCSFCFSDLERFLKPSPAPAA